jgi:hypothetical protein
MKHRKTHKRRPHSKRKTPRRINKRKTIKRKKGGVSFETRRTTLLDTINQILIELHDNIEANGANNINEENFVDRIREFEPEADEIDAHFGNHQMEDRLNEVIEEVMGALNLINPNFNNNNNNNNSTVYIPSRRRHSMNNNNRNSNGNNSNSNISMMNESNY